MTILGDVFEDIESYFLSLYLNNEKNIEKINFKTLREAENLLNVFKNALIDGYLYYKDNTDYLKNNNNISENKEIDIKSREILNYLIESLNFNEIFVWKYAYINLWNSPKLKYVINIKKFFSRKYMFILMIFKLLMLNINKKILSWLLAKWGF